MNVQIVINGKRYNLTEIIDKSSESNEEAINVMSNEEAINAINERIKKVIDTFHSIDEEKATENVDKEMKEFEEEYCDNCCDCDEEDCDCCGFYGDCLDDDEVDYGDDYLENDETEVEYNNCSIKNFYAPIIININHPVDLEKIIKEIL